MITENILAVVADAFGTTQEQILSESRVRPNPDARKAAAALMLSHPSFRYTYEQIGTILGGKDHSTVCNMKKRHDDLMETEKQYRDTYLSINVDFINKEVVQKEIDRLEARIVELKKML